MLLTQTTIVNSSFDYALTVLKEKDVPEKTDSIYTLTPMHLYNESNKYGYKIHTKRSGLTTFSKKTCFADQGFKTSTVTFTTNKTHIYSCLKILTDWSNNQLLCTVEITGPSYCYNRDKNQKYSNSNRAEYIKKCRKDATEALYCAYVLTTTLICKKLFPLEITKIDVSRLVPMHFPANRYISALFPFVTTYSVSDNIISPITQLLLLASNVQLWKTLYDDIDKRKHKKRKIAQVSVDL